MMSGNENVNMEHPGKRLAAELNKQSMSRKELSIRTGFTEKHISTVINEQKSVSPSFAKKLGYALGDEIDWTPRESAGAVAVSILISFTLSGTSS